MNGTLGSLVKLSSKTKVSTRLLGGKWSLILLVKSKLPGKAQWWLAQGHGIRFEAKCKTRMFRQVGLFLFSSMASLMNQSRGAFLIFVLVASVMVPSRLSRVLGLRSYSCQVQDWRQFLMRLMVQARSSPSIRRMSIL